MTAVVIPFPKNSSRDPRDIQAQAFPAPSAEASFLQTGTMNGPAARQGDDVGVALADLRVALSDQRRALGEWRFAISELAIGVADLGFVLEGYQQGLDDAKKRLGGLRDEATRLGAWVAATG